MADFFDHHAQDAVDTRAIAYQNSPKFRTNQRLVLWLQAAFRVYPNLQQEHLDTLTPHDLGEFLTDGKIDAWDAIGT